MKNKNVFVIGSIKNTKSHLNISPPRIVYEHILIRETIN